MAAAPSTPRDTDLYDQVNEEVTLMELEGASEADIRAMIAGEGVDYADGLAYNEELVEAVYERDGMVWAGPQGWV
jgi:hypothetical protein